MSSYTISSSSSTTTTPTPTTMSTAPSNSTRTMSIKIPPPPHYVAVKTKTFPWKLHEMLELADQEGFDNIVSWLPDGKSFKVYNPVKFVEEIMPNFFLQSKYKSFQRQLNLWGYERLATGPGKGGYHHPHFFFRENVYEIYKMQRCKIKGVAFSTSSPKSSSVSNKKTISAATDNSSSRQQHQQVLIPAKKKQNIKISSKTAKHKRQPPSSAASVVSQGSSDCELSPITPTIPPKTLTTTAMMMLSTSFPGSNKINGTGASTSTHIAAAISSDYDGSSQSMLEDFDLDFDDSEFLSPQVEQQESTSTATTTCTNPPQTGDYVDFEGRSYFFLDEIETVELLLNPPTAQAQAPRRVSIQNQVHQQLYQHPCQLQPKQQQYLPSPYVPLRHQHQHVAVPMGMVPPPSECLPNPSQVVAQVQVRVQAQAQHQTSYLTTANMLSEISRRRVSIEMYNSAAASRITYNHVAAAAAAAAVASATSITEQHTTKSSSREQQDSDDGDNVTTTENN